MQVAAAVAGLEVGVGAVVPAPVAEAAWFRIPSFKLPNFGSPSAMRAILAIAPIAIATIPESTAHLYQMSLYIDQLAKDLGRPAIEIKRLIGALAREADQTFQLFVLLSLLTGLAYPLAVTALACRTAWP